MWKRILITLVIAASGLLIFAGLTDPNYHFGLTLPAGPGHWTPQMTVVAGVALCMAVLWVTELLPIPATSLIPLAAFPLFGLVPPKVLASAYGSNIVILLMAGFMLATALEKVELHQRIALVIIRRLGCQPAQLLAGFMTATALLSMWISNTASTLMMVTIVSAVVAEIVAPPEGGELPVDAERQKGFMIPMLLGTAYAASLGGISTPIGTPPNLIMFAQYQEVQKAHHLVDLSFASWMAVAVPIAGGMLLVTWWLLQRRLPSYDQGMAARLQARLDDKLVALGPMNLPQFMTLATFAVTCFLWTFRRDIELPFVTIPGWAPLLGVADYVDDSTVGILMIIVMFGLPVGRKPNGKPKSLLDWETAARIPWGMLLLFGGGIALARALQLSGVSGYVGSQLTVLEGTPVLLLIFGVCVLMTFLTEITSNVAVTTIMMPILAILSEQIQIHPLVLMIPAVISASFAFMMPVATAPNAIVYASGKIPIKAMVGLGVWLNLMGSVVVALLCYWAVPLIMGLSMPAW